jgi:hypothetical protein
MKNGIVRAIAALATAAMLALCGAGVASAGAAETSGTPAAQVAELRDALVTAADTGDVAAAQSALSELDPLLADIQNEQRYGAQSRDLAGVARQEAAEAAAGVEQLAGEQSQAEPAQQPPVTEPLKEFLKKLIKALEELLNSLP